VQLHHEAELDVLHLVAMVDFPPLFYVATDEYQGRFDDHNELHDCTIVHSVLGKPVSQQPLDYHNFGCDIELQIEPHNKEKVDITASSL